MVWCWFRVVWCRLVVWLRVVWCRFVGRFVLWVLCLALVGDFSDEAFTMVSIGDDLSAAVREVHGVGALGLVAVTVLTVLEVGLGVVICHIVGEVILGRYLRVVFRGWVVVGWGWMVGWLGVVGGRVVI